VREDLVRDHGGVGFDSSEIDHCGWQAPHVGMWLLVAVGNGVWEVVSIVRTSAIVIRGVARCRGGDQWGLNDQHGGCG